MTTFLIRRILQAIPTLFGISIISYMLMLQAPGDPVKSMTFDPRTTPRQREILQERYGVNDPALVRYSYWLLGEAPIEMAGVTLWEGREVPVLDRRGREVGMTHGKYEGILRGDFGNSLFYKRPVLEMIWERMPATIELGGLSLIVGFGLGIPIGILAAVWKGSIFDNFTRISSVVLSSVPVFWLGLMLILIFGAWLDVMPMGSRCPLTLAGCASLQDRVEHLILPVLVLSTGSIAVLSRYMRAATLEVLSQDYIRTAQAKGLSQRTVWFVHATRNALIPIATILGPSLTGIIGGALITESIFAWPGVGRLAYEAVLQQDYPLVMAVVMISSVATIVGYLLSDIFYAMFDPRIRLG